MLMINLLIKSVQVRMLHEYDNHNNVKQGITLQNNMKLICSSYEMIICYIIKGPDIYWGEQKNR